MTAVAARVATADDAVELIWERVLDGTYSDAGAAARDLWRTFTLKPDERDFLTLYGLIELAKTRQRLQRNHRQPAIANGAPHGKAWDSYIALTWPAASADGSQIPLGEFTIDDLAAFAGYAGGKAQAYLRRQAWASKTIDHCKTHGVSRIADLPADVMAEVAADALEAMGQQR